METIVIAIFLLGYLFITLEHNIKVDKLIPALAMMAVLWAVTALMHLDVFEVNAQLKELEPTHLEEILLHHLGKTAEILIFLLGAMTIVEIIDYFNGFVTIKNFIRTRQKTKLLWIFSILAFILSAIIDNLTATIVLITILQKVIHQKDVRLYFAGLIILNANAGGAWSPIGDVTTTMLWIANKVDGFTLVNRVLIPSMVCMIVPTVIASRFQVFRGEIPELPEEEKGDQNSKFGSFMLFLGLGAIVFVPFFKTVTHLPPYVGMMLSLSIVALAAEILTGTKFSLSKMDNKLDELEHDSPVHTAMTKIELPSILFFLGILMAVACLESLGILFNYAEALNHAIPNKDVVVILLGIASAVIDNVPLVAASMGMFSEAPDHPLWHFIAYSAGTGGSMLIIGSAAGVVAMGMEKIDFFWFLKKITWLALVGFLSGALVFVLMRDYL
ncbi:MAG: sodium:proton antiporter [Flavobacteriaceae bacterium]|nr:sodium:proton antiporter [Flavobacteriaceae bacterium]